MAYRDNDIELNFREDWTELLRKELTARGYVPPQNDEQVSFAFFNLLKRLVTPTRRTVHVGRSLTCPAEHQAGYEEVTRKVRDGLDLTPHLSRKLSDIDYDDGLLNDWGIHHLHLGTRVSKHPPFVERTGPVLFARFTEQDAYFILINKHGTWSDIAILEEFHAAWPLVAGGFQLQGVSPSQPNPTANEISMLRKAGVQTLVSVGGKVLFPMGRGITTSGLAVEVVERSDRVNRQLQVFEELVVQQKSSIFAYGKANGVEPVRPVRLKLRVDSQDMAYALSDDDPPFGCRLAALKI
ncbi:MAG TPA: hypothetical protein VK841_07500 [Polyangiaceae bacterium]|jgi:hypothetical protein|nr:hypothetical protein [Polyangiaceae bacterium]